MKILISFFIFSAIGSFIVNPVKRQIVNKSNIDTLNVNYTYWWTSGGPFTGLCGDPYSLVFTGIVKHINQSIEAYPAGRKNEESLYTSQKGTIEICDIKFNNPPDVGYKAKFGHKYSSEKYFASDCFYKSKLNEGDKVIVFLFSYEGEYCIPNGSILKIEDFNDPIVKSVENYIFNKQNPLSIQDDIAKWKKYGLDYALKQIIECRLNNEITR